MPCRTCDDKGWLCDGPHERRPYGAFSRRADACNCTGNAIPCICNEHPMTDTRHGQVMVPIDQAPLH